MNYCYFSLDISIEVTDLQNVDRWFIDEVIAKDIGLLALDLMKEL